MNDTGVVFKSCVQAAATAVALVQSGDDAGAGRALERASKRLGELCAVLPQHARQVRKATEAVDRARRARLQKHSSRHVAAARRSCGRALA